MPTSPESGSTASSVKASEVVSYRHKDYIFTPSPENGGLTGTLMAWGRSPQIGTPLGLRARGRTDPEMAVYRVTGSKPKHVAADFDGFIVELEFIPGRDIEQDEEADE